MFIFVWSTGTEKAPVFVRREDKHSKSVHEHAFLSPDCSLSYIQLLKVTVLFNLHCFEDKPHIRVWK